MPGLLQQAGAQPNREPKFVPLFMDRAFTGLYTQRAPLHDPADAVVTRFYGGRPDALWDGSNVELTNRLTLQRRPGLTQFSPAIYPTPPNRSFDFELTDGTIQVVVDTGSTGQLNLSSVESASGTTAVYHGVFPDGGANAYVGMIFTVTGFTTFVQNNGPFICTASTVNTLTLANSAAVAESRAAFASSTGAVYYDNQVSVIPHLLFGKAPGAVQTHFVAVAGVLYMGDGVEVKKYTPNNPNGEIWNWGIAAPTAAPTLLVKNAGSATVAWQANTFFSTMGLLVDSNSNIQVLTSVNADGTNPHATFGTSSLGGPLWNHTIGGITVDGPVHWRNIGTLNEWQPTSLYSDWIFAVNNAQPGSASIYDSPSKSVYLFTTLANFAFSGPLKPSLLGVAGVKYPDSNLQSDWFCSGPGLTQSWLPNTLMPLHISISEFPLPPNVQTSYMHTCIVSGTTPGSYAHPSWATNVGELTSDRQLLWVNLGSKDWAASTKYTAWHDAADPNFSAIVDSNGNFQVCIQTGISGLGPVSWNSGYGTPTNTDGGVMWMCVGPAGNSTWSANVAYALPLIGFAPPSTSNPYGSASVQENGFIQYVVESGLSSNPGPPTWDNTPGEQTADNQVTWFNNGAPAANSFSWSTSVSYVYAYKARLASPNDPDNTVAPVMWALQGGSAFGEPMGSRTGAVSSASPSTTLASASGGSAVVTVTVTGSLDPQVDTIEVYRTTDGGATYLFLMDLPAPAPSGGLPGTKSFLDFMPDTAAGSLPGLNPLIPAAVDGVNNPPVNSFLPMAFNYQRIWGGRGSSVDFSGGPDTLVGNPNEAFSAADTFPFLATVVRAVKTTRGLVVFLTNSVELIAGGPATASFFSVTLAPGIGLQTYNALDVYGGEIFFMSADSQFQVMSPELQLSNFGFPIGDKLVRFDASKVYVAVFQSGLDAAIFVADGSTGWYRLNPRQVPGGYSGPEPIWSPFANITNGCQMVQTIEVRAGIKKLLVGSANPSHKILQRDLGHFTDDGTPYDAFFTMGSIVLAHPGQLALLKFLEIDFSGVQYAPTVSYLLNEISGNFANFTQAPIFDPPSIYGKTLAPTSYSPNRYYFNGEQQLARCRHLQIKVDLGATSNGDELYNLTIFGRLVVEP